MLYRYLLVLIHFLIGHYLHILRLRGLRCVLLRFNLGLRLCHHLITTLAGFLSISFTLGVHGRQLLILFKIRPFHLFYFLGYLRPVVGGGGRRRCGLAWFLEWLIWLIVILILDIQRCIHIILVRFDTILWMISTLKWSLNNILLAPLLNNSRPLYLLLLLFKLIFLGFHVRLYNIL